MYYSNNVINVVTNLLGLKGLVKEMHCWPSSTNPLISETSLVQADATVASIVSGHAPEPPRHCSCNEINDIEKKKLCCFQPTLHACIIIVNNYYESPYKYSYARLAASLEALLSNIKHACMDAYCQ